MKKKILIIIGSLIVIGSIPLLFYIVEKIRIKNATILVELIDNLEVAFNSDQNVSNLIKSINGKIIDDYKIDTLKLGKQEIKFDYINDEKIKIYYSFDINVIDNTAPIIWIGSSYTINTNFQGKIEDKVMCVDDTDDKPNCYIEGNYNTKKPGNYELIYHAIDKYGNEKIWPFTLKVQKPSNSGSSQNSTRTSLKSAIEKYKNENTKIGIDVSTWQGNIDFEKVKNAGVEFAIIRVGSKWGMDGEYFIDSQFEQNIEGFNKVGIPVGIYFYSYAKTEKDAKNEALWVIDKIKNYKVDLPIAYDWENWSSFNKYNLSMLSLTNNALSFLETIESHGYKGMNYSSKSYLESIWLKNKYPTWLAHYTTKTDYKGDYMFWQFCNNGQVDGINGNVDLNVMYIK